jgi:hypothetical protein
VKDEKEHNGILNAAVEVPQKGQKKEIQSYL